MQKLRMHLNHPHQDTSGAKPPIVTDGLKPVESAQVDLTGQFANRRLTRPMQEILDLAMLLAS